MDQSHTRHWRRICRTGVKTRPVGSASTGQPRRLTCIPLSPDKFYKGRSQEKTPLRWLKVFLLLSPLNGARSGLTARTRCSVAGHFGPAIWVFSTSRFHCLFATKPVCSETSKAESRSSGDHSSIRDSWPIAFSGYPRGPRVGWETGCPKHAAPNLSAETRSRTRVSREPHGHRERRSPGWSGLGPRHSSCLWFQMLGVEAHSSLPHDQHNGGNLPGQGQPRHFRPHAPGQQFRVELREGARLGRGDDRRTLEHILQIVIVISV